VRQWSADVIFFVHTYDLSPAERARLEGRGIRVVAGEIARLVIESDRLTGVELTDGRVIARTALFIRPANIPHADGLLSGLGCELDAAGFPTVDSTGRTSTFGVWAAGNVVDPRAQVITSAGAGSAAAIAINADRVVPLASWSLSWATAVCGRACPSPLATLCTRFGPRDTNQQLKGTLNPCGFCRCPTPSKDPPEPRARRGP
jgi:Pyridine nucleotide-disulphide oxidoreductase